MIDNFSNFILSFANLSGFLPVNLMNPLVSRAIHCASVNINNKSVFWAVVFYPYSLQGA